MRGGYLSEIEFMVAEDNDFARKIVRDVLKALGAGHTRYATDGAEALNMAKSYPIDIALIDWNMPVIDGLEFTNFIRKSPDSPNPFLPIIMISSYSEHPRVIEARDAGVNEYLVKPFSAAQLLKRIQIIVENPRPFVRTENFFGPDRRRRTKSGYMGEERRVAKEEKAEDDSNSNNGGK